MFKTLKGQDMVMEHLACLLQSIAAFEEVVHSAFDVYFQQHEQYLVEKKKDPDTPTPKLIINNKIIEIHDLVKLFEVLHFGNIQADPRLLNRPIIENELAIKNLLRKKLLTAHQLELQIPPLPHELEAWIA
jgi:hypothetical protein